MSELGGGGEGLGGLWVGPLSPPGIKDRIIGVQCGTMQWQILTGGGSLVWKHIIAGMTGNDNNKDAATKAIQEAALLVED